MKGFGGMLSFELRDPGRVDEVLHRFQLATPALSLGGVETLVCLPSKTSHRLLSPEEISQFLAWMDGRFKGWKLPRLFWVVKGLIVSAALYAALFGLTIAGYRTLYLNSDIEVRS